MSSLDNSGFLCPISLLNATPNFEFLPPLNFPLCQLDRAHSAAAWGAFPVTRAWASCTLSEGRILSQQQTKTLTALGAQTHTHDLCAHMHSRPLPFSPMHTFRASYKSSWPYNKSCTLHRGEWGERRREVTALSQLAVRVWLTLLEKVCMTGAVGGQGNNYETKGKTLGTTRRG